MKRKLILWLGVCLPLAALAQANPKRGYILTLENDTVFGTINYRSDARNANVCSFMADGEAAYRDYAPQEINGYRFADNGAFYVTRTFPVDGTDKTFFAEYLVKGGVSLFYHREGIRDYYYFVDEAGRVAVLNEVEVESHLGKDIAAAKRDAYKEVIPMFNKSQQAVGDLWKYEPSRQTLSRITREYDEVYCTESGDCVQFQYDAAKTASVWVKFRVEAGLALTGISCEKYQYVTDIDYSIAMPQVGVGCDFIFPRFNRNFAVQALLLVGFWSGDGDVSKVHHTVEPDYRLKLTNFEGQIGASYQFGSNGKVLPYVRGGLAINQMISSGHTKVADFYRDGSSSLGLGFGAYVGAGVDIAIGSHFGRIGVNYVSPLTNSQDRQGAVLKKKSAFEVNVGFRL